MILLAILMIFGACLAAPIDLSIQETSDLLHMMTENKETHSPAKQSAFNNETIIESVTFDALEFCPADKDCFASPKGCKSACDIIYRIHANTSSIFIKNLRSWEHLELSAGSSNSDENVFVVFQTKNFGLNARHLDGGLLQINSTDGSKVFGERRTVQNGGILWSFDRIVVQQEKKKQLLYQKASIGEEKEHEFKELYPFGAQEVEKL
ncbi:unnamed protein product [Caenorhabditis nigoni]